MHTHTNFYNFTIKLYHFYLFKVFGSVALSILTLLYRHDHSLSPKVFSSSQTEALGPLKAASPIFPLQALETTILLSTSVNLTTLGALSGIVQYLSFCNLSLSHLTYSPSFIYVVVCVRIPCLSKVKNIPLSGYSHILSSIHPLMNTWVASTFWQL